MTDQPLVAATPVPRPASELVSIVVPFFNAARFLDDAVGSVLAQTYRHWELLLVDDGSTDASGDLARRWAAAEPDRIRCLAHADRANRGVSASRNLGIASARGEFVATLDADDVWFPRKLEEQMAIRRTYPGVGLVYGRREYWTSWTGNTRGVSDTISPLGVEPGSVLPPGMLVELCFGGRGLALPVPSDLLFRRDLAIQLGGFEEGFAVHEDTAFLTKLGMHATVYVSGECWTRYRQHPASCVATMVREGRDAAAREVFVRWLAGYLEAHGARGTAAGRWARRVAWSSRHPLVFGAGLRLRRLMGGLGRRVLPGRVRSRLRAHRGASRESPTVRPR